MTKVKICGITNWADAKTAIDAGADALGFNFYAKSPRRVAVSHAREIVRHIPRRVCAIGVFVDAPVREILNTVREVKLGAVQLHGDESPQVVKQLSRRLPVIKAFRVRPTFHLSELKKYPAAAAFLLDGFDGKLRGGTGKSFDWSIAKQAGRFASVIVAGGITRENARKAIRAAKPFAIDVCSGVEASPGKKDARKVREFMSALKVEPGKKA